MLTKMLLTESVLAVVVIVGCGIDVLDVSMSEIVPDVPPAIDVGKGWALVSPAVSKDVATDWICCQFHSQTVNQEPDPLAQLHSKNSKYKNKYHNTR